MTAAGILVMPSLAFKPLKKKVGIQLYTLRDQLPKDVKGVIRKVAAAGYKEVETYGYSVKDKFWGLDPKSFKALLDETGLKAPSGHYGMDTYIKTGNADELKSYIEAANIVGGRFITVPWLGDDLRSDLDGYKNVSEKLNQAAELCKASGLKLAYHNHDFEFRPFGDSNGYQVMLKETDPNLVHFEMDLYWVVRSGNDPVKLFNAHPGRFPMWHVKDMDKNEPSHNTEVGNGSIDFKEIFKHSRLAGLKHAFLEQENNYVPDPFESIKKSYSYISSQLMPKD